MVDSTTTTETTSIQSIGDDRERQQAEQGDDRKGQQTGELDGNQNQKYDRASEPIKTEQHQLPKDDAGERKQEDKRPEQRGTVNLQEKVDVTTFKVADIHQDPKRFQYKSDTDSKTGASEKLKDRVYQDALAGVITIWKDPADGKFYVINGHHRLDLAKRNNVQSINVQIIGGESAQDARVLGALQNIAEGQGTVIDAAKIFRDMKFDISELTKVGLSLTDSKTNDGMALSNLSQDLFDNVVNGMIAPSVGIIIGRNIKKHSVQEQFIKHIKGRKLNNSTIEVMAKDINASPVAVIKVVDLFGTTETEQAEYEERAKIIGEIINALSKVKNLLGKTAKGKEFLEQFGNKINEEKSKGASQDAAIASVYFDRLRHSDNNITQIINDTVNAIKKGEKRGSAIAKASELIIDKAKNFFQGDSKQTSNDDVRFNATNETQEATSEQQAKANKILDYLKGKIPFINFVTDAKEYADTLSKILGGNTRLQALQKQYEFLFNGKSIAELLGKEFEKKEGITLKQQINDFFNSIGNKVNSVFGDVLLDNRAFKDNSSHGLSREKIIAFKALPEILKKGIEVLPMGKHKSGENTVSGMVAAPIAIDGKVYIAVAVIRKSGDNNRLYVHEVTLKEKLLDSSSNPVLQENTTATNQGVITKVLKDIVNAKNEGTRFTTIPIESVKNKNRKVLRIDEHGKNIVWENNNYFISHYRNGHANQAILWDKKTNTAVGRINGTLNSKSVPNGYISIDNVNIDKKHRGQGLSQKLYQALIDFSDSNVKGIASYLPDRINKKEIPHIWNKLGAFTEENGMGDVQVVKFLSTPQGDVLGFVYGGKIYLDATKLTPELIAEEFTHLQQQALRLASKQGNEQAQKIVQAWDNATNKLADALISGNEKAKELLKELGISESELESDVYKQQAGESKTAYKERLQDEIWAKAQKVEFAKHLERLSKENKFKATVNKMIDALKDFAKYVGKQLGIYNAKEWDKLSLSELIERTNKELAGDKFLKGLEQNRIKETERKQTEWSNNLQKANDKFNEELSNFDKLPKGHVFQMGNAGAILQSTGVPNLPIELKAERLKDKSKQQNHTFEIKDLKDLVRAIQNPLAVFSYGDKAKSQNVITQISIDGKNVLVGIHFNQSKNGIEINDIRGLYPKDNAEWLNWATQKDNQGNSKMLYIDKQKVQDLITQQRTNLAEVDYLDLNSVTKVIKNFENPISKSEVENVRFQVEAWHGSPHNIQDGFKTDDENAVTIEEHTQFQKSKDQHREISQKNFETLIDKLKKPFAKAFEKLNVTTDINDFNTKAKKQGVKPIEFTTSKGEVYGAKLPDGTIYINPEKLNANTPIHEFSHLWEQIMPNAWKKGLEIFKQTKTGRDLVEKLKKDGNYENLSEEQLWSESMNTLIGNLGESKYHSLPKGKLAEFVDWVKDTLAKFINTVTGNKELNKEYDLKDFTNKVLGDLLGDKLIKAESVKANDTAIQYAKDYGKKSDFNADGTLKESVRKEIEEERNSIIEKAKADGTYKKAPNGEKTNLNEEQWVTVRTSRFKDWFGDWENGNKLDLIENNKPTLINPNNYSVKQIEEIYHSLDNGVNKYDNKNVRFVNSTLGKLLRHKGFDTKQIIPQLKQIFDNAVPILSETEQAKEGHKQHTNFNGYHHYLGKIKVDGKEMYVRFTVQELNAKAKTLKDGFIPNELHSTFVSDIEIYNANSAVISGKSPTTNTGDGAIDTKLQHFFEKARNAKENSSKVIDENGEPLVVYHGTSSEFNVFNVSEDGDFGKGIYFGTTNEDAKTYARIDRDMNNRGGSTERTVSGFLNFKNPYMPSNWEWKNETFDSFTDLDTRKELQERGFDGIVVMAKIEKNGKYTKATITNKDNILEIVAFSPNQIKSATSNVGTFGNGSNDIRFQVLSEAYSTQILSTDAEIEQSRQRLEQAWNNFKSIGIASTPENEVKKHIELLKALFDYAIRKGAKNISDLKQMFIENVIKPTLGNANLKNISISTKIESIIEDFGELLYDKNNKTPLSTAIMQIVKDKMGDSFVNGLTHYVKQHTKNGVFNVKDAIKEFEDDTLLNDDEIEISLAYFNATKEEENSASEIDTHIKGIQNAEVSKEREMLAIGKILSKDIDPAQFPNIIFSMTKGDNQDTAQTTSDVQGRDVISPYIKLTLDELRAISISVSNELRCDLLSNKYL